MPRAPGEADQGPGPLPSGVQSEIRQGEQRAVVTEVGASLRQYWVGSEPLLDGFEAEERSQDGRGQLLLPWPNRIRQGRYRFQGRDQQLPLSEPARGNAIHGLVRWERWQLTEREPHLVRLRHLLHPQPGYDFTLELEASWSLGPDGLRHDLRATNVGASPLPFGSGAHPYLRLPGLDLDRCWLRAPASLWLESDPDGIPRGTPREVSGTGMDLRRPRPLAGLRLDTAFSGLECRAGRWTVELSSPGTAHRLQLWADAGHPYLMLFTGDSLPHRRRQGIGVEPMTCAPDAFRSGAGLLTLEPGETFRGSWGIRYT